VARSLGSARRRRRRVEHPLRALAQRDDVERAGAVRRPLEQVDRGITVARPALSPGSASTRAPSVAKFVR
jgi:hypothetical protein